MNIRPKKKIDGITWEEIVLEAMQAISAGHITRTITTEEMYQWIEKTEYITEYGRMPDIDWNPSIPSYRASLMLRWQRMVANGIIIRSRSGVYSLQQTPAITSPADWLSLKTIDDATSNPKRKAGTVQRIQRSQKLRDALINYYNSQCQICSENSPYLFPSDSSGVLYSEVHHLNGLAEAYLSTQSGQLFGFRVNGLGNLVVLCPHHHAVMHHHYPPYQFDREHLCWQNSSGSSLTFRLISLEHKVAIRSALNNGTSPHQQMDCN